MVGRDRGWSKGGGGTRGGAHLHEVDDFFKAVALVVRLLSSPLRSEPPF